MAGVLSQSESVPDLLNEIQAGEGQSLSAVGRQFPAHRGGGTVDPSTVFRWVKSGSRAADGRIVRLEACRVGGRWITTRSAVARFIAALSAPTRPSDPNPVPRSPAARSRAAAAATAELDARMRAAT